MSARAVPTLAEMVTASAHCRDIAGQQVQRTEQALEREQLGPARDRLLCDLSRYRAEREHWSNYTAYYRGRVAKEGAGAVPSMTWRQEQNTSRYSPPQETDRRFAAVQDRRLPREAGDDDLDDGVPF